MVTDSEFGRLAWTGGQDALAPKRATYLRAIPICMLLLVANDSVGGLTVLPKQYI